MQVELEAAGALSLLAARGGVARDSAFDAADSIQSGLRLGIPHGALAFQVVPRTDRRGAPTDVEQVVAGSLRMVVRLEVMRILQSCLKLYATINRKGVVRHSAAWEAERTPLSSISPPTKLLSISKTTTADSSDCVTSRAIKRSTPAVSATGCSVPKWNAPPTSPSKSSRRASAAIRCRS